MDQGKSDLPPPPPGTGPGITMADLKADVEKLKEDVRTLKRRLDDQENAHKLGRSGL